MEKPTPPTHEEIIAALSFAMRCEVEQPVTKEDRLRKVGYLLEEDDSLPEYAWKRTRRGSAGVYGTEPPEGLEAQEVTQAKWLLEALQTISPEALVFAARQTRLGDWPEEMAKEDWRFLKKK
jgi:hypothetical protein